MRTLFSGLFSLMLMINIFPQQTGNHILSTEEMQSDFLEMRKILEEEHGSLYEYTSKSIFDSLFAVQYSKIKGEMHMNEFFALLAPITAKTGCGHTSVWMPGSYWTEGENNMFPLIFNWIGDKVVVTGSYNNEPQIPPGTVIHTLNGREMNDILMDIYETAPSDALIEYGRRSAAARRFPMYYTRLYGFPSEWRISYTLPGNKKPDTVNLLPATNAAARAVVFKNFNNPELSLKRDPGKKIAILTIDSFIYYDRQEYFRNFLDSCFSEINNSGIDKLIIDLRNNDGGDPYAAAALLSHIEPSPLPYYAEPYNHYEVLADPVAPAKNRFTGKLAVLISGRCFSTNGHFCALLKYHKIGTIIGSPSGATYKCNGGRDGVRTLENSKIMLYFTRSSYAVAVSGMDKRKPIMPDIPVEETPEDIAAGRDPVLESAISFLRR